MSTKLISGARMFPRPLSSRPAVCFYQHQHRSFGRSTRLREHEAALPTEARELASQVAPAATPSVESPAGSENLSGRAGDGVINVKYIGVGHPKTKWYPASLRDSCTCPLCKDPSSTQKTFQTTDIPPNIEADSVEALEDRGVKITWKNDIPGFGPDHVSTFSKGWLHAHLSPRSMAVARFEPLQYRIWHKERITRELESIKYKDYMKDDKILHRALLFLNTHGLLILKGVPESETAVEDIASRMGKLRDTFYGRTWDVKSVPEAKNVAYTHQYLGLHMDLLYMANPPGFQLLHCLKNTCEGGSSLFADAFQAAYQLSRRDFNSLCGFKVAYQYKNAGEHYYFSHRVIEEKQYAVDTPYGMRKAITQVNWSPPFQADLATAQEQHYLFPQVLLSLRAFAKNVEAPENLYEYKMQEGDCVIFNNRRVLHGRREFDATGGERWLKGAYVDTDVFMSRWRVLNEKFEEHGQKIYQGLVDKEVHKEITPEKKNVNNYGPPFKRKAEIKAEMEAEREAETKLNPPL